MRAARRQSSESRKLNQGELHHDVDAEPDHRRHRGGQRQLAAAEGRCGAPGSCPARPVRPASPRAAAPRTGSPTTPGRRRRRGQPSHSIHLYLHGDAAQPGICGEHDPTARVERGQAKVNRERVSNAARGTARICSVLIREYDAFKRRAEMKNAFATTSVVALLLAGPALAQAPATNSDRSRGQRTRNHCQATAAGHHGSAARAECHGDARKTGCHRAAGAAEGRCDEPDTECRRRYRQTRRQGPSGGEARCRREAARR